jgi:hypothetical protein
MEVSAIFFAAGYVIAAIAALAIAALGFLLDKH